MHYVGHGTYKEDLGGFLLWEDERGNPLPLWSRPVRVGDPGSAPHSTGLRADSHHHRDAHACQQPCAYTIARSTSPEQLLGKLKYNSIHTFPHTHRLIDEW